MHKQQWHWCCNILLHAALWHISSCSTILNIRNRDKKKKKNYEDHWMPPIVRLLAYKHSLYLVAEARVNGIAMHLKLGDFFLPYFVSDLEKRKGSVVSQKWSIYLARLKIFSIMSLLIKNGFNCHWNFATASFAHISIQQKVWPDLQEVSLFHNVETYQL